MAIYINGKKIASYNFSAGECHVEIVPSELTDRIRILAKLYSSDEIMQLLMVVDAVRQANSKIEIDLIIPYFPYARQDRVCNKGESFSVKVMADLINQLHCQSVTVCDPHSQVTIEALDNCCVVSLSDIICSSMLDTKIKKHNLTLISPDKGAKSKVQDLGEKLGVDVLCANKVRDSKTGHIMASEMDSDVTGKDCIIVDDICDGGQTFIELAKLLVRKNAGQIYLYVTHGIFSKGLTKLKEYFSHIYCYQTMLEYNEFDKNFLTILDDNPIP